MISEEGSLKKIPLGKSGKFAIVDDGDFDEVSKFKWCLSRGYAQRTVYLGIIDGKQKFTCEKLHRLIANPPKNLDVDHIDHDKLNNQRSNLRIVTTSQNIMNCRARKVGSSRYKGVSWQKSSKKWTAQIGSGRKKNYLGCFSSEREAAIAYNKKALELFGEYAHINSGVQ